MKQEETGVGNRPGDGDPDRDRASTRSESIVRMGVHGSIVMAGSELLRSLVGVVGSSKFINTVPVAECVWQSLQAPETQYSASEMSHICSSAIRQ